MGKDNFDRNTKPKKGLMVAYGITRGVVHEVRVLEGERWESLSPTVGHP